jgi:general secretion pathway protein B
MSYILDALKKAERERGIAQVPTISTVHDFRGRPRVRMWAASGIFIVCLAAALWFFLFKLKTDGSESGRLPAGIGDRVANHPASEADGKSAFINVDPSTAGLAESSVSQQRGIADEIPKNAARINPASPPFHPRETLADTPAIAEREPSVRTGQFTQPNEAATVPPPGEIETDLPPQELMELPSSQQIMIPDRPKEAKPATDITEPKPMSLREAISKMTLSILLFSENKEERLVFINGKRYVEGDNVDDKYLLESITPEGAVLSYRGERAVLRPGSK